MLQFLNNSRLRQMIGEELQTKISFYASAFSSVTKNSSFGSTKKSAQKKKIPTKKGNNTVVEKIDRPLVVPLCGRKLQPSSQKFYITTAINYTNGLPHVGHAYEAVTTDVIARYHRLAGRDVFFLTGTDEHGQKVEQSAIKANKTPQQIADFYASHFEKLDKELNISYDSFIRTTDKKHEEICRALWKRVKDTGDIYLKPYVGWYDVHSEQYVTDFEAEKNGYKDEHGRPYEKKEEESYFFRMSKYQNQLVEHIKKNPTFIQPETRRHEILRFLEEDLHDLCVSRTQCQWGVACPPDPEYKGGKSHVMYVWFDALTNYLSGVQYMLAETESYKQENTENSKYWPASVHIIGKDIVRFHCIYWPCMLMSANVPLPESVFAHGFVRDKEGIKMSKSLGNVVDPMEMYTKYNVDSFRFYVAMETSYGSDLSFNEEGMVARFNAVLSSGLGNLVHRSTSLCKGYTKGLIPSEKPLNPPFDLKALKAIYEESFSCRGGFQIQKAGEALVLAINDSNKFLQEQAPWKIKGTAAEDIAKKNAIVRASLEAVYALAHFLSPFCPGRVDQVFEKLGVSKTTVLSLNDDFENLPAGVQTYVGEPLYTQLEVGGAKPEKKEKKKAPAQKQKQTKKEAVPEQLFYNIDIRVGQIKKVWHHPDADGLFCEEIDVGEESPRQIASGLRAHYKLEDLNDRKVLTICNLKAANLKGFKSHGMVLCATKDGKVEFCDPPQDAKVGERIVLDGDLTSNENIGDPMAPNSVSKKKAFQKLAVELGTDDNCNGTYKGIKLITTAGPCKAKTLV
eukprot:maker-scaffold_69-snap-gene-0.50-mRNA-1 protein AED:0.03 eAED:0.03 QI:87/0.66/0.5/1/1/1/4/0/792